MTIDVYLITQVVNDLSDVGGIELRKVHYGAHKRNEPQKRAAVDAHALAHFRIKYVDQGLHIFIDHVVANTTTGR